MSEEENKKIVVDTNYDDYQPETSYFDSSDNSIYTEEDLQISPFDVIKKVAEKMGQIINDPKPSCKHCYGRGYVGRDSKTKSPIPCMCIHPKYDKDLNDKVANKLIPRSRKHRRQMDKLMRKHRRGVISDYSKK